MATTDGVDTAGQRKRVAERLAEAGLSTRRFIDVHDGEKRSTDHTRLEWQQVRGNYGVYGGGGLVDVDIDDYDEGTDIDALRAVAELPETFTIQSPHTDGDAGGHRYYKVTVGAGVYDTPWTVSDVFDITLGVNNPTTSWGEIRLENQYVVGPGSQLDGCTKEWCDECAEPGGGYYRISKDVPIAEIDVGDLLAVLQADPTWESEFGGDGSTDDGGGDGGGDDDGLDVEYDEETRLGFALSCDEKLERLWSGDYSDYGGDRSKAESALAMKLAFWLGPSKTRIRKLMDGNTDLKKWHDDGPQGGDYEQYHESVLEAVDIQTEFFGERGDSSDSDVHSAPDNETEDGGGDVETAPKCPQCYGALGSHTMVDGDPSRRRCGRCRVVFTADEVMR